MKENAKRTEEEEVKQRGKMKKEMKQRSTNKKGTYKLHKGRVSSLVDGLAELEEAGF